MWKRIADSCEVTEVMLELALPQLFQFAELSKPYYTTNESIWVGGIVETLALCLQDDLLAILKKAHSVHREVFTGPIQVHARIFVDREFPRKLVVPYVPCFVVFVDINYAYRLNPLTDPVVWESLRVWSASIISLLTLRRCECFDKLTIAIGCKFRLTEMVVSG